MEGGESKYQDISSWIPTEDGMERDRVRDECLPSCFNPLTSHCSRLVFEAINFSIDTYQDEDALHPPTIDSSPQGKQNRVKLLRAWVEVSAWLTDYKRKSRKLYVNVNSELLILISSLK